MAQPTAAENMNITEREKTGYRLRSCDGPTYSFRKGTNQTGITDAESRIVNGCHVITECMGYTRRRRSMTNMPTSLEQAFGMDCRNKLHTDALRQG